MQMVSCDIKQIWIINTFSCIYCAAQIINAIMIETKRATVQACNSINTKHDKGELYSFKQRKQHINQSLATHTSSNMHQVFHTYGGNLHWITFYVCEQNFVLILSPILIKKDDKDAICVQPLHLKILSISTRTLLCLFVQWRTWDVQAMYAIEVASHSTCTCAVKTICNM